MCEHEGSGVGSGGGTEDVVVSLGCGFGESVCDRRRGGKILGLGSEVECEGREGT